MNSKMFAKGMGFGVAVGTAIGMTVAMTNRKGSRQNKVSKAIRAVGDIVENIGSAFNM